MTEIIDIVEPGGPNAPSFEQLEQLGFDPDRNDEYRQLVLFQTTDSEYPVVPVVTKRSASGHPTLEPQVIVSNPLKIAPPDRGLPGDSIQKALAYIHDLTNFHGATLKVTFGSLPEIGSPERISLMRTCAAEMLRLAHTPSVRGEGTDITVIPHGDPRDLTPRGPSLGQQLNYYKDGTEIPIRIEDVLHPLYPHRIYTAIRPEGEFTDVRLHVIDTMNMGGSAGGPRTDMVVYQSAYRPNPDGDGDRSSALSVDKIGVQEMTFSVFGEPVIQPEPDKVDFSGGGRLVITEQYAPVAAALAFKLSGIARDLAAQK